jgi:hypothetical protein
MEIINGIPTSSLPKIEMARAPLVTDIGYNVPTLWLDTAGNQAYVLVDVTAGVATWTGTSGSSVGLDAQNSVLSIATATSAPPTETLGDRYLLSSTGTPHANWDGGLNNQIGQFNGALWVWTAPNEGMITEVEDVNTIYLYITSWNAWQNQALVTTSSPTFNAITLSGSTHGGLLIGQASGAVEYTASGLVGEIIQGAGATVNPTWIGANNAATKKFFTSTGTGALGNAPTWDMFTTAKGTDFTGATVDLATATGCVLDITTDTTALSTFGTVAAGATFDIRFMSARTLTYNVTSFILPGARDIVTEAGDRARFISLGSGNWYCAAYMKANGRVLGDVIVATDSSTSNITADKMRGQRHYVTGAYTLSLPTAAIGYSAKFIASTAAVFSLDVVTGTDAFYLNGVLLTAGNKCTSDGTIRATIEVECYVAGIYEAWSNTVFIDGGS